MNARPPHPWIRALGTAFILAAACAAALGHLGCASGGGSGGYGDPPNDDRTREADPRPLDPLTPAEREAAQQAALADSRVREVLGGERHRVVSVDFLADKGPNGEIVRSAEVLLYRPDRDVGVRALVHLQPAAVVAVTPVPGQQVPLTDEDYQLANELVQRSSLVQSRFGEALQRAQIEVLRELPSDPDDPCTRHRCVFLLLRLPEGYLAGPRIVIDLTAREVRVKGEER